jgi:hypothetical protein
MIKNLFVIFGLFFSIQSSSQIKLSETNSQIGMSYYNLLKYHGVPLTSYSKEEYQIMIYKIEFDLGELGETFSEYFGKSYSFFLLKDNNVIGSVVKLQMHNNEMLVSFFDTARQRRVNQYQKKPIPDLPTACGWTIYSPELQSRIQELLMVTSGQNYGVPEYWGIIGGARENDFDKLTLILDSKQFTLYK